MKLQYPNIGPEHFHGHSYWIWEHEPYPDPVDKAALTPLRQARIMQCITRAIMGNLSGAETKVLLAIYERTILHRRLHAHIKLEHFIHGVKGQEGTGLSKRAVTEAIKRLLSCYIIQRERTPRGARYMIDLSALDFQMYSLHLMHMHPDVKALWGDDWPTFQDEPDIPETEDEFAGMTDEEFQDHLDTIFPKRVAESASHDGKKCES